jgi:beta-fructofuranosidase
MKRLILPLLWAATAPYVMADVVAHFPMEVAQGQIAETVSGARFDVCGQFAPESAAGVEGQALRLDGYTSYVDASLGALLPAGSTQMTFSLWTALEAYPIVRIDQKTTEQAALATCLDETAKQGFGFYVGQEGGWSFRTYVSGWAVEVTATTPLPVAQWNCLTATVDCSARQATLYLNGRPVGTARCSGTMQYDGGRFVIGRSPVEIRSDRYVLNGINGLIDEVYVRDEALPAETVAAWTDPGAPDLSIPASRFADDLLRPRFHGMPAAAWTNECHGMIYADGRYHLFFQKNADGPFMARLHWGHLSSANLYDWTEEPIALRPGADYDVKGCWSGCVYADSLLTGGEPRILYTAVDYARAVIAQASPDDAGLLRWTKSEGNPLIDGRPEGLSDDFRDPYFFRGGEEAYIMVGSSKGGVGTTTLHRYQPASDTWTNDGTTFFTGTSAEQDGTFWEMPNLTPMGDDRWLFTATPLQTARGVRTLYWTGTLNADGTFAPTSSTARTVEMTSEYGYGLLSPTVCRTPEGKTLALGIVPDKLAAEYNYELGWAHCYSLPREWSLDVQGALVQQPYSGLTAMRSATAFARTDFDVTGTESLTPVTGREVELVGRFTVGDAPFGFQVFGNAQGAAVISYNPSTGVLTADFTGLNRWENDGDSFRGVYRCTLPEFQTAGSELKLQLYVDHSILDLFVNDRWATSLRVFPTDEDADGVAVFSDGTTHVRELQAWTLRADAPTDLAPIVASTACSAPTAVEVYDLSGHRLRQAPTLSAAVAALPRGMYLIRTAEGVKKVMVSGL